MSTQFSTVVAETSGRRGHRPPCPAGLGGNLLWHPLHRPPLGSSRRQYLPPVLVEVKLPNVSGAGQRVEKHLTCRVVSRRRDLYEIGVSHVLLRSNSPPGSISSDPRASSPARQSPGELLGRCPFHCTLGELREPPNPTLAAPIWLDESGQPRPTRPCPRCGREAPVYWVRPEHLRLLGRAPFRVWSFVNCCGHAQGVSPALEADGRCRLIRWLGEAI